MTLQQQQAKFCLDVARLIQYINLICEEIIKKETGIDVDLSPESKENDK